MKLLRRNIVKPAVTKADLAREVTQNQPRMRRLLNGQTVPREQTGRTWLDFVAPGPNPDGGRSADPRHPSRKHDVR